MVWFKILRKIMGQSCWAYRLDQHIHIFFLMIWMCLVNLSLLSYVTHKKKCIPTWNPEFVGDKKIEVDKVWV